MPSRPSLQACPNTVGPSSSRCSLNRRPGAARASTLTRVALRTASGSVVAIEFDQVESIQEHVGVMAPVSDAIEARNPVLAACDRFPVDDAGPRAQPGQRLDDQRKAVGQVIAR